MSNSSRPRCTVAHWFADGLATTHQLVRVPHLQPGTLPVRRGVELTLNRGAQHRPQVGHQLVGVEPQRRLLVGLAGEDWLGRANHAL